MAVPADDDAAVVRYVAPGPTPMVPAGTLDGADQAAVVPFDVKTVLAAPMARVAVVLVPVPITKSPVVLAVTPVPP